MPNAGATRIALASAAFLLSGCQAPTPGMAPIDPDPPASAMVEHAWRIDAGLGIPNIHATLNPKTTLAWRVVVRSASELGAEANWSCLTPDIACRLDLSAVPPNFPDSPIVVVAGTSPLVLRLPVAAPGTWTFVATSDHRGASAYAEAVGTTRIVGDIRPLA